MNESTSPNTRRLPCQCRVVGFLLGVLIGFPAWSQTGCEEVPEPRRAQCEKVMDCMAIEAADVRRACIDAAQKPPQQPARILQPTRIEQPPQTEEPIRSEPRQEAAATTLEQQTVVIPRETSAQSRDAPQAEDSRLRKPAQSFTAQVTRVHQSILDRQVIALDNSFVFVSDLASPARLKAGQTVEVNKASSRRASSRTWRITGPNRHRIEAVRVRCESDAIGGDDRRRCAQMLDR